MGGALANFAGLLHMTMHSLTKSAHLLRRRPRCAGQGTQRIADIRGLTESHPMLGWGLVLGVAAIAGMPPLGIFMSEFLVVSFDVRAAAPARHAAGRRPAHRLRRADAAHARPRVRRRRRAAALRVKASHAPMFAHLALVLLAGVYLPAPLVAWFQNVAARLG